MVGVFEVGDLVEDKYGEKGTVVRVNNRIGIVVVDVKGAGNQYYAPEDLTLIHRGDDEGLDLSDED